MQGFAEGHVVSTDIIVASARAYINTLNKMLATREEKASMIEQRAVG